MILGLALFLRAYNLGAHDGYTDEVLYAFRAVGLIDYDTALVQPTPWYWFDPVPWWAHLSFHDHPIMHYLLQHISIGIFGENLIAVRILSVTAGVASVYWLYLIGKKLVGEKVGLIAAAFLGVSSYHLWATRLGIQDGVVIFLMLLTVWIYLQAASPLQKGESTRSDQRGWRNRNKWWLALGAAVGLGIITKYTFVIIIPVMLLHAIIFKHKIHKNKYFWYSLLVAFLVATPSWLYNLKLYQARGHFDFQISAFLKQDVPEWSFRFGRSLTGGTKDRVVNFFLANHQSNSQVFNLLASLSFVYALYHIFKKRDKLSIFLMGSIFLLFLWFLVIGSTYRFVVMVIPWLILLITSSLHHFIISSQIQNKKLLIAHCSLLIVIFFEIFHSSNTFLVKEPLGKINVAYAQINQETQNFGFNQLEKYLNELLAGKMPLFVGTPKYDFITKFQEASINKFLKQKRQPFSGVIIYEHNLNFLATLWYINRRQIYEGWPILSDTEFEQITGKKLDNFYREQGVEEFIYITAAGDKVLRQPFDRVEPAQGLKGKVGELGVKPFEIKNRLHEPAFQIYRF